MLTKTFSQQTGTYTDTRDGTVCQTIENDKIGESISELIDLIYKSIETTNHDQTLSYIDKALKLSPENEILYFLKGIVLENMNKKEEAIKSYLKAIALKENYFDALFNLGTIYYNEAARISKYAMALPLSQSEEFDNAQKKLKLELLYALPYFEKAYEINSNDSDLIEVLYTIYVEFRDDSKNYMAKYLIFQNKKDKLN